LWAEPNADPDGNRNCDSLGNTYTNGVEDYSNSAAPPDSCASAEPVSLGAIRSFLRELAKQFASSRKAVSCLYQECVKPKIKVERVVPWRAVASCEGGSRIEPSRSIVD
jgi:hypothetical protein